MMNYREVEVDGDIPLGMLARKVMSFHSCTKEQIQQLIQKPKELTANPSKCVGDAIERIKQAQKNKEKIFIGGDYDADGICSTTILYDTLQQLGIECGYYIPNRLTEGYGLNEQVVEQAHQKGYNLIITVDNGVRAIPALKKAKELGIEVMVTDHHEYDEEPECTLLVHPKLMDEPFQGLSGAGVVLQIANGLIGATPLHLGLAAIATMGDVVPLWNENRIIVRLGLEAINRFSLPTIQELFSTSTDEKTEQDLAFQVVPKLNATGRLREIANPNVVVKYFLLKNLIEIKKTAMQLNDINNKRKEMTVQLSVLAERKVSNEPFIVLEDARYHEGIVGILASKIANKYCRPTLVFTEGKEGYKGSGRSIPGFDMQKFFSEDFDEFIHFGGHEQAIGCTVKKEQFEQFKEKIKVRFEGIEIQKKSVDTCLIHAKELTNESFLEYCTLAPFGQGFEDVLFAIEGLKTKSVTWIKQKFVKIVFENGFEGICFEPQSVRSFEEYNLVVAQLTKNSYGKGAEKFSIIIKNME